MNAIVEQKDLIKKRGVLLQKKQEHAKLLKILPIEEALDKLTNFEPKQKQAVLYKTFFLNKNS